MKILTLIPARGGSKRLPGKNIKELGGLPLIAWTLHAARDSSVCAAIVVSTDDEAIAAVAREHGADVPGLRPAALATDTAGSVDVALHALDLYEAGHGPVDGLLLLQPTSPFRTADTIRRGVALFAENHGRQPVVGVSAAPSHPAWCFRTTSDGMEPFLGWDAIGRRSQDLEPAWALNGAFYLIAPARLRQERRFLTPDTRPLMMDDPREAIDIDSPEDWALAEASLSREIR
ncbi:cytidylyltransferase domain-containing protein [Zoogloea sp.]|uniref:acylneuraminate cytidylyltransferase family protein n=1 Tax=Zoogloea sp. TaxID=49181 RepID=UPI0035AF09E2